MPHDPIRIAETMAWLKKAAEDLRLGDIALQAKPPVLGGAVFHAQQAAEKALKAFLFWRDRPFRRTHDLAEIGSACAELDASLHPLWRRADRLTVYAWVFRYPGEPEEPLREEAEEALGLAREVYEAILARLPQEARP
ncbi:MAG: HEPN domain-containing protein [Candidatus Tectomicrobia bacterium]|nr:HEPN domain-containing protein [Candidatus Tectomicrobia bacterium]